MWDYYFNKDMVTLEVLHLEIIDNQTFDAGFLNLEFQEGHLRTAYELFPFEEDVCSLVCGCASGCASGCVSGYVSGYVKATFDRELSSLEEEEISGYVIDHISADIKTKSKYKVKKYTSKGKLEKTMYYFEKDGDYYKTKIREVRYVYNSSGEAINLIDEAYDLLGKPSRRKRYTIYSDPITGEAMLEEE